MSRRSKMKKRLEARIKGFIEMCKKRHGVDFTVSDAPKRFGGFNKPGSGKHY